MDDIFSYLIYAIIIISFLSSFLKKKEPAKQSPLPKQKESRDNLELTDYTSEKDVTAAQTKSESYDILKELEKVFNSDFKVPAQQNPQTTDPYDIYQSTAIKDTDLSQTVDPRLQREVEDKNPIGYRPAFDVKQDTDKKRGSSLRTPKQTTDYKSESEMQKYELVLAGIKSKSRIQKDLSKKLKNPATLKEYILFSEILRKPKALRR